MHLAGDLNRLTPGYDTGIAIESRHWMPGGNWPLLIKIQIARRSFPAFVNPALLTMCLMSSGFVSYIMMSV
jgi:hypothetical protein